MTTAVTTTLLRACELTEGMTCLGFATRYDRDTIIEHRTGTWKVLSARPCSVKEYDDRYTHEYEWLDAMFIRWGKDGSDVYEGIATYASPGDLYIVEVKA